MHRSGCYEQQVKNTPQKNPVQGGNYKHIFYYVFKSTSSLLQIETKLRNTSNLQNVIGYLI